MAATLAGMQGRGEGRAVGDRGAMVVARGVVRRGRKRRCATGGGGGEVGGRVVSSELRGRGGFSRVGGERSGFSREGARG